MEGVIPNLLNVPIRIYQSADDVQVPPGANRCAVKALEAAKELYGGYDYEYWEVTGRGHTPPPGGYEALFVKIADKRRQARPNRVLWQPTLAWKRDFYWLHWDAPKLNAILIADLDRESNQVRLQVPEGAHHGLGLWLDSATLDIDREVTVFVNDKQTWRGQPTRSLQALLHSADRGDAGHIYPVLIRLDG